MTKLYRKNELLFALVWIAVYVVLMSGGDNLSQAVGIEKIVTAPISIILTAFLYLWIRRSGLKEKYGLCPLEGGAKKYLYFIPLVLLALPNVWQGFQPGLRFAGTFFSIVSMLCVGFLEEVIFRGFLFKALCRDNVKQAVLISSITFGFGHIVNLFRGQNIPETLSQIVYAAAIGFLFTILFYRGKSLWPCILTHSAVNSLSVTANHTVQNPFMGWIGCIFLTVVSLGYAAYILKVTPKKSGSER